MADHVGIIAKRRLAYEGALREGTDLDALFMDVCRRAAGWTAGVRTGARTPAWAACTACGAHTAHTAHPARQARREAPDDAPAALRTLRRGGRRGCAPCQRGAPRGPPLRLTLARQRRLRMPPPPRVAATVPHASATPRTATPRAAAPAPTRLTCFVRALRPRRSRGSGAARARWPSWRRFPSACSASTAAESWAAGPSAASPRSGGLLVRAHAAHRRLAPDRVGGQPRRAPEAAPGVGPAAAARVRLVGEGRLRAGARLRREPRGAGRSIIARHAGSGAPSLPAGLAICIFLTLASAWMVPAGLALATRLGTLAGIALPALVQLGCGIALWSNGLWYLFPPATALRAVSPLAGVAPSGVPLAAGDPLGTFGWQTGAGLAIARRIVRSARMRGRTLEHAI